LGAAAVLSMASCSQAQSSSGAQSAETVASSGAQSAKTAESGAQTSVDQIKSSGTVVMSTNAEFEPFEYKDGNKIIGIDVDIANAIAQKLGGVKLKINDVAFDSLTMELQTGKCNFVAAGMTITPDKQKNVDFSDPYFDATQSIIVLKGSPIQSRTGLNGKKVGVQQGTTGDTYCTNEKGTNDIKVGEVKRFNKGADAISDLMNGRIDAVVIDDFPAQKFVSKHPEKLVKLKDALTVEHYAIAVKKGDKAMLDVVNSVLKELKSSGKLDKIVQNYKSSLEGE
ncbi:MAG TPA: ABC transporter substrate-binding protein, partial [Ruminococcaceae bacterium]|nr:ABC transporter substrate-binding protein [Oscillospiraceae bacterium]